MKFTLHEYRIEYETEAGWFEEIVDIEKTLEAFNSGEPVVHSVVRNKLDDTEKEVRNKILLPIWAQRVANALTMHVKSNHDATDVPAVKPKEVAVIDVPKPPESSVIYRRE